MSGGGRRHAPGREGAAGILRRGGWLSRRSRALLVTALALAVLQAGYSGYSVGRLNSGSAPPHGRAGRDGCRPAAGATGPRTRP
jgi:hypothetical protein